MEKYEEYLQNYNIKVSELPRPVQTLINEFNKKKLTEKMQLAKGNGTGKVTSGLVQKLEDIQESILDGIAKYIKSKQKPNDPPPAQTVTPPNPPIKKTVDPPPAPPKPDEEKGLLETFLPS